MKEEFKKKEKINSFIFKDEYGRYEIPGELKLLLDENPSLPLNVYITRLMHVACFQQDEYKGRTPGTHFVPQLKEDEDPVEVSSSIESITRTYEGSKGMKNFIKARDDLINEVGEDLVLKIEKILGVDSGGIDGGDDRPLLGVDTEMVKALSHYRDKFSSN